MKVKIIDILNSEAALGELVQMPLPAIASYKIAKVSRQAGKVVKDFVAAREKAVERHGIAAAPGEDATEEEKAEWDEKIKALAEELEELAQEEVEFEVTKLPFKYIEDREITPAHIATLEWLIDAPEEE